MSEDELYDAAEREMDLYRREIMRLTAEGDSLREQLATVTGARDEYRDNAILHIRERDEARARLAVAEAERNDLRQALDERNRQLEGLTRVVIDVTDRPVLAGLAAALRADAGMTFIDQFSKPGRYPTEQRDDQ